MVRNIREQGVVLPFGPHRQDRSPRTYRDLYGAIRGRLHTKPERVHLAEPSIIISHPHSGGVEIIDLNVAPKIMCDTQDAMNDFARSLVPGIIPSEFEEAKPYGEGGFTFPTIQFVSSQERITLVVYPEPQLASDEASYQYGLRNGKYSPSDTSDMLAIAITGEQLRRLRDGERLVEMFPFADLGTVLV